MEGISERIAKVIEQSGLTKTAFAEKLNITQAYVSKISIGNKVPSDRTIMDICREFDVNEHWLRTGEGEMFVPVAQDQSVFNFIEDALQHPSDSFKFRFVTSLPSLTESDWATLEKLSKMFCESP